MRLIRSVVCGASVVAMCLAGQIGSAHAAAITYTATDLSDVVEGEDIWRYEYIVSDFLFDANQGFSIDFDSDLYADLESSPLQVSPDWDIITLPPDPGLPAAGLYDALALVSSASLAQPFVLTFAWLGAPGTAPGSQAFTLNQFDADGNFVSALESGQTVSAQATPVPEPSTLLLLGSALAIAIRRKTARRSGAPIS